MGQDESQYVGTTILDDKDIPSLVKYMKSDACKNVIVMLGAGIPDFRSPETGLYANLARLNLPYPEAVFEINFFRSNPRPFYTLAKELMPGKFRPTLTHSFVRLLAAHSLLKKCFTQNIDTLERRAGVPPELIVEAHGSFANQHCIECRSSYDGDKLRKEIHLGVVATCEECEGLVKPDIVFFGEQLPAEFHRSIPTLRQADLLIVMGTSLTVHPFASLATMVPDSCPRVLVNLDLVGNFGTRPDDVCLLGKTDEVVRELVRELGWEAELDALWQDTAHSVVDMSAPQTKEKVPTPAKPGEKEEVAVAKEEVTAATEEDQSEADEVRPSEDDVLEAEVAKLTAEVEKILNVSEAFPEPGDLTPRKDDPDEGHEVEGKAQASKDTETSQSNQGKL
ncbi:hypothetical protein EUX98_g6190 [Antrodiella citrinella]|uniref:Deacetylase sirtuin-type domain-containing protein n=1 Tax=Antrodiella citrinella TaxID=2447956 RepID=A0A4S4MQI7_9APHY|nr:hypothetical protein EUX98_g6190 [Antrodiella citrinella]